MAVTHTPSKSLLKRGNMYEFWPFGDLDNLNLMGRSQWIATVALLLSYFDCCESYLSLPLSNGRARRNSLSVPPFNNWKTRVLLTSSSSSSQLKALIPMSAENIELLVSSGKPTGDQYAAYWGRTKQEQYNTVLESATVAFLGMFFSYFLSFVIGSFVATIMGTLFLFWGILSPELKAYQRNWEFLGGRPLVDYEHNTMDQAERAGLFGALFLGRISDVCVVEDTDSIVQYELSEFSDYTMEEDDLTRYSGQPYLLRVQCSDRLGRTLQIHCRLSEKYLYLRPGMPASTLLLSTSPSFDQLAALTDFYVIDDYGGCWIGDYPYLNRAEIEALFATDNDLWERLLVEADEGTVDFSKLERTESASSGE